MNTNKLFLSEIAQKEKIDTGEIFVSGKIYDEEEYFAIIIPLYYKRYKKFVAFCEKGLFILQTESWNPAKSGLYNYDNISSIVIAENLKDKNCNLIDIYSPLGLLARMPLNQRKFIDFIKGNINKVRDKVLVEFGVIKDNQIIII